ncbi:hypothetical protein [Chloroflexus aggregans]|uniref:Uncharacterized protein n=1 Tax=Chloroflexus aggregans (strain MD-66 / DSM 9485) TaxID=326427 RepID=B8GD93_CHLAD|nr:hypothetical protein [Chloroflexus aggregans]ACL25160.1 hypothetical protein Cagg_2280 [Chloroflexus aggregans DSM 9485]
MNSSRLYSSRLLSDRPAGSALVARQRLRQTLERERLLVREPNADQRLLVALLAADVPTRSEG